MRPTHIVLLVLLVSTLSQTAWILKQRVDLVAERERSNDLDQEILAIERGIILTETLREYTGEVAEETSRLEASIKDATGADDLLSTDLVDVLDRLRETASGSRAGTP